ncbi:hypothetical protein AN958_09809 [Leucoagaricus sp. SymC.cos]|nr:hypothetical protein AN958_09809 [Leucoagaricus sp. SymC.cos]
MGKSHLASVFTFANTPQVMCNSYHADTAIVWFDITDTQSGTTAKHLITSCYVWAACSHSGIPICQHCWWWGHSTRACHLQAPHSPWCAGPHTEASHCLHTSYCRGNPSICLSQELTPEGAPCSHATCCVNCKGDHSTADQ